MSKGYGQRTRYNGMSFDSYLDAVWAKFFNECGWPWEYKPIAIGGYYPSFILGFPEPALVSVQPALWEADPHHIQTMFGCEVSPSWGYQDILLVGSRIIDRFNDGQALGRLGEYTGHTVVWSDAEPTICKQCGVMSYRSVENYHLSKACLHETYNPDMIMAFDAKVMMMPQYAYLGGL